MSIYRTHRPTTFEEVVGQGHVTDTIKQQIANAALSHAYLFCGPRGVGKTTTARLIARAANCTNLNGYTACGKCDACKAILEGSALDIVEIDAASHTGVDNVRENIIENVRFAPSQLTKKVFIIDEVHMLSKGAFNALLKTLEEPPAYAMFILATTELHKIPETIVSRCQRYDFRTIAVDDIVPRLQEISKKEGVEVDLDVLEEVARRSEGCLRDAESLLGAVLTLDDKHVTAEIASQVLPMGSFERVVDFLSALAAKNAGDALTSLKQVADSGMDMRMYTDAVIDVVRGLLLARMQMQGSTLKGSYTEDQAARAGQVAEAFSTANMTSLLKRLVDVRQDIGSYHIAQLPLELVVVEICGTQNVNTSTPSADPAIDNIEPVVVAVPDVPVSEPEPVSTAQTSEPEPAPEPQGSDPDPAPAESAPSNDKEMGGAIDIERVKKVWPTFKKALRERHASLPLALEMSEPMRIDGNVVTVKVQFEFYAETVNQPKNNSLLAEILSESCGTNLGMQGTFANVKDEEEVGALLNAFGGEVVG